MTGNSPKRAGCGVRLQRAARAGFASMLALMFAACAMSGCNSNAKTDPTTGPRAAGMEVTAAVPAGLEIESDWGLAVSEWEAATSATVELREYEIAADRVSIPEETDLLIAPLRNVGQLVDDGWPGAIPESVTTSSDWRDLLGGAQNLSLSGGRPTFLPLDCPVFAVYYRADLLAEAGLSPPSTWADYDRLLHSLDQWAPGLIAVEPQADQAQCTLFLARAAGYALHPDNYSLLLDVEDGAPLVAEPPFRVALDEAAAVQPLLDPASLTMEPEDCYRAVLEGRAAIGIGFPGVGADRAEGVSIGVCRLPGAERIFHRTTGEWEDAAAGGHSVTVAGLAGFLACVASTAESPEFGWHLLSAVNEQTGGLTRRLGYRGLCHAGVLQDAMSHAPDDLQPAEWQAIVETHTVTLSDSRVVYDLPLPERERFEQSLLRAIRDVQSGEQSSETALGRADDDWAALIDELGRRRVLNVYRQCVGLSPLPEGFGIP